MVHKSYKAYGLFGGLVLGATVNLDQRAHFGVFIGNTVGLGVIDWLGALLVFESAFGGRAMCLRIMRADGGM